MLSLKKRRLPDQWINYALGNALPLVRLVLGLVRTKLIALYGGPAGVLFSAHFSQLQTIFTTLMSFGLVNGTIQELRSGEPFGKTAKTHFTTLVLATFTTITLSFLAYLFYPDAFTIEAVPPSFVLWAVLMVVSLFGALSSGYLESFLFGLNRFRSYVLFSIIASVVSFIVLLTQVQAHPVSAIATSALAMTVVLFFGFLFALKTNLRELFRISFPVDRARLTRMFLFSILATSPGLIQSTLLVVHRSMILNTFGSQEGAWMQIPLTLSQHLGALITSGFWGTLFFTTTSQALKKNLALVITLSSSAWLFVIGTGPFLIRVLYSQEFTPAKDLFLLQAPSDLFSFINIMLSIALLGQGHAKKFFVLQTLPYLVATAVLPFWLSRQETGAWSLSFLVGNFITYLVSFLLVSTSLWTHSTRILVSLTLISMACLSLFFYIR